MKPEEKFLDMMIQSISLLSFDFDRQVRSLPDFVHVPDEFVLTFHEAFLLFDQVVDANLVNEVQVKAVQSIDNYIEKMQVKKENENQWTLESMQDSPDWNILRLMAKNALSLFEKPKSDLDLGWIIYVKGKKSSK